ncbi:hypothetical protein D3C79_1114850 [compost metagenome]
MDGFANGVDIAHQSDKAFGEIAIMRHSPQGSAVAVNNNRIALQHPFGHLP